jgi:aryl-alcohol dehydrogenase-like predicted oxidoreductase
LKGTSFRGLITNTIDVTKMGDDDFRKNLPRFTGENLENNQALTAAFAAIAQDKHCTPAQLAIAWVLSRGEDMLPIPGTKKRKYLVENAGAADVELSAADLTAIEALLDGQSVRGQRYLDVSMKMVNL